jgi:hypothetical protein
MAVHPHQCEVLDGRDDTRLRNLKSQPGKTKRLVANGSACMSEVVRVRGRSTRSPGLGRFAAGRIFDMEHVVSGLRACEQMIQLLGRSATKNCWRSTAETARAERDDYFTLGDAYDPRRRSYGLPNSVALCVNFTLKTNGR